MIQLPYKLIAGLVLAVAVLLGWFITYQSLRVAKADLAASEEREARLTEVISACQANRHAIEERLDQVVGRVAEIAAQRERLQGAIDNAGVRAREISEARDALARLQAEHDALVNRAVPLTACQTFEMVLAAFAGGSYE